VGILHFDAFQELLIDKAIGYHCQLPPRVSPFDYDGARGARGKGVVVGIIGPAPPRRGKAGGVEGRDLDVGAARLPPRPDPLIAQARHLRIERGAVEIIERIFARRLDIVEMLALPMDVSSRCAGSPTREGRKTGGRR